MDPTRWAPFGCKWIYGAPINTWRTIFVSHYVWILTMDSDALMEADPERARRAARQLPDAWTWRGLRVEIWFWKCLFCLFQIDALQYMFGILL